MQLFKKYLKRTLAAIGIVLAALFLFLLVVGLFYGEKVKQVIVKEISKKLSIELTVNQIDFSVFRNFPSASVELIGLKSAEKLPVNNTPMLTAGRLSLLFDIFDMLWGDYTIEKLVLKDALLNLVVINEQQNNFTIFQSQDDGKKTSSVVINLQKVLLNNVQVFYYHQPSDQEYIFEIINGNLEGAFSRDIFTLEMAGDIHTKHVRSGENLFLKDRDMKISLTMNIDRLKNLYTFRDASISSPGINLSVDGSIQDNSEIKLLNLTIRTDKTDIQGFLGLIPEQLKEDIRGYSIDGEFRLNAKVEGEFSGDKVPQISFDFEVMKGKLKDIASGIFLQNVSFKGNFENGSSGSQETYKLVLHDFIAGINAGQIKGELVITNFRKPYINASLTSVINLDKLDEIIHIDDLESISGLLELNIKFNNTLKNLHKFTINDFISSRTSGTMKISNVDLKIKNNPVEYRNLKGSFQFNNKDLLIEDFSGNINESDFNMKGYLLNILAYAFIPGEDIKIKADFTSSKLNMDDLLSLRKDKSGAGYRMKFSDRVNFNLDLKIADFTFGTFRAQNITGNPVMKDKKLNVNDVKFNSMEGKTELSGWIDGNYPDKFWISFTAGLQQVNISELFSQLGEFGQQNITSNQIRGKVDATIYYKSFIDPELNIDPKSVYALGDIVIHEGELIRYTPLYKLSKYIKQKELEHIRFSTLINQIEIKEEVVYIPEMDIESSTLDLKIFGNHSFKNTIDYHIRILLSELLSKKDKPKEEEIEGIFRGGGRFGTNNTLPAHDRQC